MLLKMHPDNPHGRKISELIKALKNDGLIVYPSDTIYGLGCSIHSIKAMKRICQIRSLDPKKARFSFICQDIKQVAEYTSQIPTQHFKLMKKLTPGPYTFVLNGSKQLPKMFLNRRQTIGVRIQQTPIVSAILEDLGHPLLSATLRNEDEITEFYTDPAEIYEDLKNQIDIVIDGGIGNNSPSTVIDLTGPEALIIREGLGSINF